ncbi:MAG: DUF3347 domain-containing protein [Flavobacterium sp.]|nr:DUF3347 domain-containing protein [Flavobacterium sp.]
MNSISKILVTIAVLLSLTNIHAQIHNSVTENVKVYGSCGMCKSKIEKAGFLKNVSKVTWNEDSQIASLEYDAKKTNQDEILKRIALVGYDSDKFLAPDKTYSKLDKCCQYDRPKKEIVKTETPKAEMLGMTMTENQEPSQLKAIFENYFALKDGLVQTDAKTASQKAIALLSAINTVKMETLKTNEHIAWMKVFKDLTADAKSISETQDIEKQRNVFNSLSTGVYELIKVSKPTETVYYQYCPMKKMNWLSKENTIKNPYYGAMMLSCGSVVETIK